MENVFTTTVELLNETNFGNLPTYSARPGHNQKVIELSSLGENKRIIEIS